MPPSSPEGSHRSVLSRTWWSTTLTKQDRFRLVSIQVITYYYTLIRTGGFKLDFIAEDHLHNGSILGRLPVVPAGDTGTIPFSYRDSYCNGAHRYNHNLARADSSAGAADGSPIFFVNSWALGWSRDPWDQRKIITSLWHHYDIITTNIIKYYYKFISTNYCIIITLIITTLSHVFLRIITKSLLSIITSLLLSLLQYYYTCFNVLLQKSFLHIITSLLQ